MNKCRVFYSWQSDLPNSTNRGFIQKALQDAVRSIRNDDSIEVNPVVDRDTVGVPGSPDIANTIFAKIDESDVFACDVSIINQGKGSRPTPNPNVLIELGYAVKSLKSERIIMIMNTGFGDPELLPFDLSKKRVARYRVAEDSVDKATERKKLTQLLDDAIRAIVSHAEKVKAKRKRSGDKSKLKEECEEVLQDGNKQEWRGLVDELCRDIPKRLLEWKPRAERVWRNGSAERDAARLEAVEICLPSFVPILVAVEKEKEDFWQEAVRPLRQLLLRPNGMRSGLTEVIEIGGQMLYIAGSLGMAIAAQTKQLDFVNRWMQLPMPGMEYEGGGEKPWAEVYSAHHLWGKYLPGDKEPFADILKICESDYLSGFFADRDRLVKYLFLGNLGQSLFELGRCIKDEECRKGIEDGDKQRFRASLSVWPLWVLMKPEEFKAATWELFGYSRGVLEFVFPGKALGVVEFWKWWKKWKVICLSNVSDSSGGFLMVREAAWLLLPGEPM